MTRDESYTNYLSHQWETAIQDPYTGERFCFCLTCGCENLGDPNEFQWLEYPPCDRKGD